jgi:hypothetical protein
MSPNTAAPPIRPPTMAPTGVDDLLSLVGVVVGVLVTLLVDDEEVFDDVEV